MKSLLSKVSFMWYDNLAFRVEFQQRQKISQSKVWVVYLIYRNENFFDSSFKYKIKEEKCYLLCMNFLLRFSLRISIYKIQVNYKWIESSKAIHFALNSTGQIKIN